MTAPWPHLGSTGVIQDPGIGGAIAQQEGQLPQILQYLQQHKEAQQRAAANQAYLAAQEQHLQFAEQERMATDAEKARQATAQGDAVRNLLTPVTTVGTTPTDWGFKLPVTSTSQGLPSESDVISRMNPVDIAGLYGSPGGKQALETNRAVTASERQRKQLTTYLGNLPTEQQATAKPIVDLYLASGEPITAEQRNAITGALKGGNPDLLRIFLSARGPDVTNQQAADLAGIPVPKGWDPNAKAPKPTPSASFSLVQGTGAGGEGAYRFNSKTGQIERVPGFSKETAYDKKLQGAMAIYHETRNQIQTASQTIDEMRQKGEWPTSTEITLALSEGKNKKDLSQWLQTHNGKLWRALGAVTEVTNLQSAMRGQRGKWTIEGLLRTFMNNDAQLEAAQRDVQTMEDYYQQHQGEAGSGGASSRNPYPAPVKP